MRTFTVEELNAILSQHKAWLWGKPDGQRADLSGANLSGADLSGANLRSANLSGADLSGANLRSANLRSADLSGADLSGADLSGANLSGADLSGADLSGANLRSANLSGADLSGANLRSANLSGADLSHIWEDFRAKLALQKEEVVGLYKYLLEGKVDGSSYTGECACFVGTLAKIKGVDHTNLAVRPDSSSPTEMFFMGIHKGDNPENNPISHIVADWLVEFMLENEMSVPVLTYHWSE